MSGNLSSNWGRLRMRGRLWSLKATFSGGSNYSAPYRPRILIPRVVKPGLKPGEFYLRRKNGRVSNGENK